MSKIFFSIMTGGIALLATLSNTPSTLARKTGGAPERLQQKQIQQYKGSSQNQPSAALARKVGGPKTRLLYQVHQRGLA